MFRRNKTKSNDAEVKNNNDSESKSHEIIASDFSSEQPSAALLRENARLNLDNKDLRSRAKRGALTTIILGGTLFTFISLWAVYFPQYRFASTSDNSTICEIPTSSNQDTSPESIIDYAKDTVLNTYSFDYINYRSKINDTAYRFYNDAGRVALFQSFDSSENLKRVINGRLILKSMATNVPQIEEQDQVAGLFWVVKVPIAIEFYAGGADKPLSTNYFTATVRLVKEKPSKVRKKPIAAEQVLLSPGRG